MPRARWKLVARTHPCCLPACAAAEWPSGPSHLAPTCATSAATAPATPCPPEQRAQVGGVLAATQRLLEGHAEAVALAVHLQQQGGAAYRLHASERRCRASASRGSRLPCLCRPPGHHCARPHPILFSPAYLHLRGPYRLPLRKEEVGVGHKRVAELRQAGPARAATQEAAVGEIGRGAGLG